MLNNSGSIAGAINKCRYGGSRRTLIFELIICVVLISIGVFFIVHWNKTQDNEINVDVSYLGPKAKQYAGMKVVRDHHNSSATKDYSKTNFRPGIYFGIATQLETNNDVPLFSDDGKTGAGTQGGTDSIYDNMRTIAKEFLGESLKVQGKDVGFVTDVRITATNAKEIFVKKSLSISDTIPGKIIKTRSFTSHFYPSRIGLSMDWNAKRQELCYAQKNGLLHPVMVSVPTPMFYVDNSKDSEWWNLFLSMDKIKGYIDVDNYMAAKVIIPAEKESQLQNAFNRTQESLERIAVRRIVDSMTNNNGGRIDPVDAIVSRGVQSLRRYVEDTLLLNSFGMSCHSVLPLSSANHIKDNKKGEQSRIIQYSPVNNSNAAGGLYYSHQSFMRPLFFNTLNDLSRVHDKIRFHSTGADSLVLMKFEYEFHTPIDNVVCFPEPDKLTGTGFVFTEPSKLRYLADNGLDVYVHFPEWDNAQTKRFFLVTLILTMIASYLLRRTYTDLLIVHLGQVPRKTLVIVNIVAAVFMVACILICVFV